MSTTYTVYTSNSYLVQANEAGTEITNLHTGNTRWLQGDDSNELRTEIDSFGLIDTEDAVDHYLSQYFGN